VFFRKKNKSQEKKINKLYKQEFNSIGLEDLLHYVKLETGIDLFLKKSIIETRLKLFCKDKEIYSFSDLLGLVKCKNDLKQEIINLLTVNETYFFREERQLQEAVNFAISRDKSVSILCAPCASGEEVYSLSMMLSEQTDLSNKFTITGVDINSEAITKAKRGLYTKRSLHKLNENVKNRYFTYKDDMYQIKSEHFLHVNFRKVNIFEDSFTSIGSFDIIFSRNMFIYFDNTTRLIAMQRFSKLLKRDGRLLLGHADIVPQNEWLTKVGFGSSAYYSHPRTN